MHVRTNCLIELQRGKSTIRILPSAVTSHWTTFLTRLRTAIAFFHNLCPTRWSVLRVYAITFLVYVGDWRSLRLYVGILTFTPRWKQSVSDDHFRLMSPLDLPVARRSHPIPRTPRIILFFCSAKVWKKFFFQIEKKKSMFVRVSVYKQVTVLERKSFIDFMISYFLMLQQSLHILFALHIFLDQLKEETHFSLACSAREYLVDCRIPKIRNSKFCSPVVEQAREQNIITCGRIGWESAEISTVPTPRRYVLSMTDCIPH